jgi:L-fuculose-phosphate aldolase
MNLESELKEEIVKTAKVLYERGLITVLGGNVSARIPGREEFWITPSRLCKSELKTEDLVKVDFDGNVLEGRLKPSVEKLMHASIYKSRPDANAVIHAHNPLTLALISAGLPLEPVTAEADLVMGKPEVVPFLPPGTEELASAVGKAAGTGTKLIVLERHGVVGIGHNLLEARAVVELAEDISKIILASHLLGRKT